MHFRFTAQIHTFELTPSGAEGPIYTGGDGQYTAVAKSNKNKLFIRFFFNKTQKSSTFRSSVQSSSDAYPFAEATSLVSLFDSRRRGVEEGEGCYCLGKETVDLSSKCYATHIKRQTNLHIFTIRGREAGMYDWTGCKQHF